MNYLAHLYFSERAPLAWAGSLMGDFLKGPLPQNLERQLLLHLELHRKIDTFAHTNRFFQSSCRRLANRYRFGRGILIDVFYDHFLACHWSELCDMPLEEFSQEVYRGLLDCHDRLPPRLQSLLPRMVRDNWLVSYREEGVVATVLGSLERRIGYRLPLGRGIRDLEQHRNALEGDFFGFIREADVFVRCWKADQGM